MDSTDSFGAQTQLNDRSKVPPRARAASRASNSSSSTSQTTSTHSHRYHHSKSERPKSQLSREVSESSTQPLTPMSALLLERLERERRVDYDRTSSRGAGNDLLRSSVDSRALRSPSPSDGRPISSNGSDSSRKRGLGVKEIEQTLSSLHKQNFDLKLELFHRRERQTTLEERLEKLELEKFDMEAINERLLLELEKRDKAVGEAVSMIVMLEARVEQLLREREMVRQVGEQGLAYVNSTSTPKLVQSPASDESKSLNRMPSFLSEKVENTDNLRDVYLGVRDSVLSLPTTAAEVSPDTSRGGWRMGSPALSILSESSFVSVYGRNATSDDASPAGGTPSLPCNAAKQRMLALESPTKVRGATPKSRPSTSRAVSSSYAHFHNITDVLDMSGSPLGRLEKMDVKDVARAHTTAHDRSPFARPPSSHMQPKTKKEKREELERVLTEGKFGRDHGLPPTPDTISTTTLRLCQDSNDTLSKDQALANERSYLALSDTTVSQHSALNELATGLQPPRGPTTNAQAASTTAFDSRQPFSSGDTNVELHVSVSQIERPRTAAPSSREQHRFDWDSDDSDDDGGGPADVSRSSSVDTWLHESRKSANADGLGPMSSVSQANPSFKKGRASPDLFSFPSSTKGWATNAMFGTLGGARYAGATGRDYSAAPTAKALDAMESSLPLPMFSSGLLTPTLGMVVNPAPPPPDRRSSLQAKTTAEGRPLPAVPVKPSPFSKLKRGNRVRSNSTDVQPPLQRLTEMGMKQDRSMTVPPKQVYLPPPPPSQGTQNNQALQEVPPSKQRHYPPTASQGTAVRPRSRGLNNFFRRSTGSADPPPPAPSSAPPTTTTFKATAERQGPGIVGMPSWGRRNSLVDDERDASATPPPIQRNRNPERRVEFDDDVGGAQLVQVVSNGAPAGGVPLSESKHLPSVSIDNSGGVSLADGGPVQHGSAATPTASTGGGGKRKWLGLGRRNSLRKTGGV
ncbi:hypothetical protein QBC38DRAFT_168441 [Podospora fimiseda]|uniref:Centrosomin N-terminal motif 1 domain-containing protein n=1 Tax=Podospora fimiseda TaxID=252190 RepID=A0AAN7H5B9_9PEZI|nr:hypothetical protein QBC38DRAFT_168441 [Podospora fimiseda]